MAGGVKEQHNAEEAEKGPSPQGQTTLFDFGNQIQLFSIDRDGRDDHTDQIAEKDLLKGPYLRGAHFDKYLHNGKGQR